VAGLDIAKAGVEVTIRVLGVSAAGRRRQETRTYGTRGELESLAGWLACWQVAKAGMEATGDYGKPVFFLLESRGFDCDLCNAGQVKALPGRPKTGPGRLDLAGPDHRAGLGLLQLRAPAPIRRLRTHTRYRRHVTQARTAEKQRAVKLPGDGHLKLSSVISDIHGVSGRDMHDALAAGQRDPKTLAQLARGSMRGTITRLEQAPDCSFFTGQHAAVLAMMLAAIDYYSTQIEALTTTIDKLAEPSLRQVNSPGAVPGIGLICAQDIIAETGTDMTVFPTAPHLVSWARWSPQVKQSAGKRNASNTAGRGSPYLGAALGEAVIGASRTPSFLGARYRRLARRMPKKKALVATGNSMLAIIYALLADPAASYHDLGPDYYEQRMHTRRQARNHIRSLERLGYKVIIQAINPGTGELQPTTRRPPSNVPWPHNPATGRCRAPS
jgi:transposase